MQNQSRISPILIIGSIVFSVVLFCYLDISNAIGQTDVFLPIAFDMPAPTATPVCTEIEPNNRADDATGPLLPGQPCYGAHNDNHDFYYFDLPELSNYSIDLITTVSEDGPQLQVYYETIEEKNKCWYDTDLPLGDHNRQGKAGRFYIYIYTPSEIEGTGETYTLHLTYAPVNAESNFGVQAKETTVNSQLNAVSDDSLLIIQSGDVALGRCGDRD